MTFPASTVPLDITSPDVPNMTSSRWGYNNTDTVTAPSGCLLFPFSTLAPWNHPEDLVSHQTQQNFKKFVDLYLLTLFFFLFAPLNIINMIVFWKHGIKERINLCLFFLSFADFIIVSAHFELKLDRLYSEITGTPYKLVVAKYSFNNMVHSLAGFIYVSGFMTTLIAFERCLCIVSPLKAHSIIQIKTAAAIIFLGHVTIFGGHYIIATRWEIICMFDPLIRQSTDAFYASSFYLENKALVDMFDGIIFGVLLPGFYVTGVSISTVITVIKLSQMKDWRQQASSAAISCGSATKDMTLTRMLIGTNILFVACTTPVLIFHAFLPFVPELSLSGKYYNTYYLCMNIQQLFIYINSSVNFFVYYFFGTKFRLTIQHMLCRWGKYSDRKKTTEI